MSPKEFWSLHPSEFYWIAEAKQEQQRIQKREGGGIDEEEALEMRDELRRARVAAGFPPD